MKTLNESEVLASKIAFLQVKQAEELRLLKNQFHNVYENLKPWELLKNTLYDVISSSETKKEIAASIIGLAFDYLFKKKASNLQAKSSIMGTVALFLINTFNNWRAS